MIKRSFILLLAIALTTSFSAQELGKVPSVEVKTMDGANIDISSIENDGKPIIINFWATWCAPCKKELNNNIEQESVLKKFKYLELKSSNFEKKVTSDEKELEGFFNENSQKYLTQRAVSFTAIPFESKQYLKSVEVDEQELMQIYESDFSQFYTPAQVKIKELVINKKSLLNYK